MKMSQITKRCWRCPLDRGEQPLENFCRNGKDSVCKTCRYQLNSEWAKDNKDKLRPKRAEYMKRYRAAQKAAKNLGTESGSDPSTKE
jgi:hypothetical protein